MRKAMLVTILAATAASPALAAGTATPGLPRASTASALSLSHARIGQPLRNASKLDGEGNGLWIIGAAGLVAGVIYAFSQKDDDEDEPASP